MASKPMGDHSKYAWDLGSFYQPTARAGSRAVVGGFFVGMFGLVVVVVGVVTRFTPLIFSGGAVMILGGCGGMLFSYVLGRKVTRGVRQSGLNVDTVAPLWNARALADWKKRNLLTASVLNDAGINKIRRSQV